MEYIIIILIVALIIEVYYYGRRAQPGAVFGSKNKQLLFVDTSVLMDGRIVELAKTGFIPGVLAVPRSVIGEMQFLADHADTDKRHRARYGLDVVRELQELADLDFMLFQDGSEAKEGVDERLLKLAKEHSGKLLTLDFNLNKVAAVEGITVLNINELAQTLRMAHLPGEEIVLELVQKGQDSHQAVGYLPDGTMVVVENAAKQIGQKVSIEIIRSIQTAAGKMMFAKTVSQSQPVGDKPGRGKPAGRKLVLPTKKQIVDKVARPKTQRAPKADSLNKPQPQPEPKPRPAKQSRRPATNEDRLLDLVNKQ